MAADSTPSPFSAPPQENSLSARTWLIAAGAVLLFVVVAAVATLRRTPANTGAAQPADPAAAQLVLGDRTMSEATNGAGGKSTYLDGTLTNTGAKTLTAATVQVTFAAADGSAPHRETAPLMLVRTRVPYVDLQMIGTDPVKPGERRDFRLIFESVPANWNVQPPAISIIRTEFR